MLHTDTVPADAFGRPFYNRTLEIGRRLADCVSGFGEPPIRRSHALAAPPPRRACSSAAPAPAG